MLNVELYNHTKQYVIISRQVKTLEQASRTAREFICRAKHMGKTLGESIYDISPVKGYVIGQTIFSTCGELHITTARMS